MMRDVKTFIKMMNQILEILNKKQRYQLVGMFFLMFIGSIFELLGVSTLLPFIQAITAPDSLKEKAYILYLCSIFNVSTKEEIITMIGIGIVIIYIIKNLYLTFFAFAQSAYANNTRKDLSILMLRSFIRRPYSFFTENGSGEIMRGVTDDVYGVYDVIFNGFNLYSNMISSVLIGIYLILTDYMLAFGLLFVGLVCMLIIIFGVRRKVRSISLIYRKASAVMKRWLVQSISGIKDIKVFDKEDFFINEYEQAYENSSYTQIVLTFIGKLPNRIIEAICVSGIMIFIVIRMKGGVNAGEFAPTMAVFAMAAFRLLPLISSITGDISLLMYNREMVDATYDNVVKAREYLKTIDANSIESGDFEKHDFSNELAIKDLCFRYEGKDYNVLDNLSVSIQKGETVGIIGESGAGKSTLVDVLLGLYKPQNGQILMDGIDIATIPRTWAHMIGYVPQAVFLIDGTIRENIVFGSKEVDEEKIWKVIKKAALEEFVRSLPEGLDTIVGERGVKFSGGQRQRIAIARALYTEPQLLILDEATSALDNETENVVMQAVEDMAGSLTMIIIAHRVTTLKCCDVIYEVCAGELVSRVKEDVIK